MGTYQISLFTAVATVALTMLFVIGLFVTALQVKQKKKLENLRRQLIAGVSRMEDLQHSIGRELHDGVGSLLTVSMLHIKKLQTGNADVNTEAMNVQQYLDEMHATIRNISHRLTPAGLKEEGLKGALQNLTDGYTAAEPNVEIDFTFLADPFVLGDNAINVYRIVQELLQNSIRHSECRRVNVRLEEKNNSLRLEYFDDGKGFDKAQKGTGIGIVNLRARTEILHGQLEYFSLPGKGTEYIILIPLNQEACMKPSASS